MEELYGIFPRDEAIEVAKSLNEDHSNDCCEVKWVAEKLPCETEGCDQHRVVRYNHNV